MRFVKLLVPIMIEKLFRCWFDAPIRFSLKNTMQLFDP